MSGADGWAIVFAVLSAWLAGLLIGPALIPALLRLKVGQAVRAEGPARHLQKAGTPTMGGLIFMGAAAVAAAVLTAADLFDPGADFFAAAGIALGFGAIGFADDFLKTVRKRSLGLRAREKLLGQVVLAVGFALLARADLGVDDAVSVPFTAVDLPLGWAYPAFVALVMLASANALNITDGLDGLAGGASIFTYGAFALVAVGSGRPGLAVLAALVVGGLLGFLRFNRHPAQVFMGDTGAMALGAGLGALAVLTATELWLPLFGGLYVLETLSVILQVISFRLTGRRILRMSPLHHHFELLGWPETRVVGRFWLVSAACAALGLYAWAAERGLAG